MTTERIDIVVSERGSRTVSRNIDEVGEAGNRAGRGVGFFTSQLAKFVSVAAVASTLSSATREAILFQDSIAEVSTLVDTATFDLDRLTRATLGQATAFGSLPTEQAAAAYQIISAGAASAAEATETLDAANRLAVGGVTDVATAADGLTSILNAYGPRVEGATAVSDALFVAMRAGKTTIAELSGSIGQVAPLAAQTGVSFDELLASVSALTKGGINTTQAVTGIRAVLASVAKPTAEATALAESLGIEFNAAALESQGLAGFLDTLVDATGGSTEQLAQLFGGVEALVPVMALAGDAGEDFASILEDMADKGGATEEAFNRIVASPGFQMDRVLASIKVESIQLGDAIATQLVPVFKLLADNMDTVFDVAQALAVFLATRLAVSMGRTVVATATTMGLRMIYVGSAMGATTTAGALLTGALGTATVAFRALTVAMAANPFGLLALAVSGVVAYFAVFRDTTSELSLAIDNVTLAIGDEIVAVQQLGQLLDGANTMSVQAAEAKLSEAEARRENILALIEERRQLQEQALATSGVQEQLRDLYAARDALAAPGTDLEQMNSVLRDRYEEIEQAIVRVLDAQQALIPTTGEYDEALAQSEENIRRIREALADAEDGQVSFNGEVVDAVSLTERLIALSNSSSVAIGAAALQAAQLARNLAAAASALAAVSGAASALDVGSIGLEAQNRALEAGNDLLEARAAAQVAQRRAELGPAFGSEDAIIRAAAAQELETYTTAVERNTAAQRQNLDLVAAVNSATSGGGGGGGGGAAAAATAELTAAQEEANAVLERKAAMLEALRSPMQSYSQDMIALTALLDEGAVSQAEFANGVRDVQIAFLDSQTDFASGFQRGILGIQADLQDVATDIEDALKGAFSGAEDALVSFVTTGKGDFKGLADSIIADILRIAIRQNIIAPLASIVGGIGNSLMGGLTGALGIGVATGGSAVVPNVGGAPGIGLATGGDFTVSGGGGVDSQLVQFRASPGERVSVTRPGESGGTEGNNVTFNINGVQDVESFKRSESQVAARMQRLLARGSRNG